MTDTDGVTVSNGYADNNAPYDVATKTIANKRFQKVILYDGSGNEVTSWTITPSGTQDVNLIQVGGVATSLGQKAEASSIPVVLATEQDSVETWIDDFSGTRYMTIMGGVADNLSSFPLRLDSLSNELLATATIKGLNASSVYKNPRVFETTPAGTEAGLVTRNIPSGVQVISRSVNAVTLEAYGKVDGSALTTSYQDLLGMAGDAAVLRLFNSTEVPVIISLDAGTTDCEELGPYENISIDYYANDLILTANTIRVKLVSGSAPTNGGSVRASVTR